MTSRAALLARTRRLDGASVVVDPDELRWTPRNDSTRTDALNTAYLQRQLEYFMPELIETPYAENKFAEGEFIFVEEGTVPDGKEFVTYIRVKRDSQWELVQDYTETYGGSDFERDDIPLPIRKYASHFKYSNDEISADRVANGSVGGNISVVKERADSAQSGASRLLNNVIARGDFQSKLPGIVNHPDAQRLIAPFPIAAATATGTVVTPEQSLFTMNQGYSQVFSSTNEVEEPNLVLVPPTQYRYAMDTRLTSPSDRTIAEQFLRTHPGVRLESCIQCKGADPTGRDVMVQYNNNRKKVKAVVVYRFRTIPPQAKGDGFVVNCYARFAGVHLMYPSSMIIVPGI